MRIHAGWAGLAAAGGLWAASPALAQEHREEGEHREREHAQHREHAEQREHAREREHAEQRERLTHVLEGLHHGMAALAEIGCHEEHRIVARVADDVRRRLDRAGRADEAREQDERAVARRRVATFRMAVEQLVGAGRHDAADLMERATHALALALEGRRDAEAAQIRERAPDLGAQVELLALAAEIAQDRGRAEAAHALADEARQLRARWERQRGARADRERAERREVEREVERRAERREEGRETDRRAPDLGARLERLEDRLDRLEQMIERLAGAIRERGDR